MHHLPNMQSHTLKNQSPRVIPGVIPRQGLGTFALTNVTDVTGVTDVPDVTNVINVTNVTGVTDVTDVTDVTG